jgi:rfaE bifunctional protein nucleotidyltransferase chain/domain
MITPKNWGFEEEIVNVEYCGKRMFIKEGFRSSIHKHEKKDEVLVVSSGLVYFEVGSDPEKMSGVFMQDNDKIRLQPGDWHRFSGLRDSTMYEFSTHHEDSDSIRHSQSEKIPDETYKKLLSEFFVKHNKSILLTLEQAKVLIEPLHQGGRTVGMCNGCFDILHVGHVQLLSQARNRCDVLFVALESDASVKKTKGVNRPFNEEESRIALLSATRFVDFIILVDDTDCVEVVKAIRPDVYITTSEHPDCIEAQETVKVGGKVEVVQMVSGFSTSNFAKKVKILTP